jgi:hypothetical protein
LSAKVRQNVGGSAHADVERLAQVQAELNTLQDQLKTFETDSDAAIRLPNPSATTQEHHLNGTHARHRHGQVRPPSPPSPNSQTRIPTHAAPRHIGSDWFDRHSANPHVAQTQVSEGFGVRAHASSNHAHRYGSPPSSRSNGHPASAPREHSRQSKSPDGHMRGFTYADQTLHSSMNPNCVCEFYGDGTLMKHHPECPLGYNHRTSNFNHGEFDHEHSGMTGMKRPGGPAQPGSPARHGSPERHGAAAGSEHHHHHHLQHHSAEGHHQHHHAEGHHNLMSSQDVDEHQRWALEHRRNEEVSQGTSKLATH